MSNTQSDKPTTKCTECQFENGEHAQTCSKHVEKPAPQPTPPTGPEMPAPPEVKTPPAKQAIEDEEYEDDAAPESVPSAKVRRYERQTGKEQPYAYTLEDRLYGEFHVLNSANGWWLDSLKVTALFQAYKIDCTDEEACAYAGISLEQLRYFRELHEDFSRAKLACKQMPILRARATVVGRLGKSPAAAQWYLERKRKDEFSTRSELAGPNGAAILEQTSRLDKLINDVAGEHTTEGAGPGAETQPSGAPEDTTQQAQGDAPAGESTPTGPTGSNSGDTAEAGPAPAAAADQQQAA